MLACFSGKKWGNPHWLFLGRKASRPGLDWRWPDAAWTLGIVGLDVHVDAGRALELEEKKGPWAGGAIRAREELSA